MLDAGLVCADDQHLFWHLNVNLFHVCGPVTDRAQHKYDGCSETDHGVLLSAPVLNDDGDDVVPLKNELHHLYVHNYHR